MVVHQYKHGFSGFAARLSKDEAAALRRKPGVVSVFAGPVYYVHTTRSWDFLQQTTAVKVRPPHPPTNHRRLLCVSPMPSSTHEWLTHG